MQKRTEASSLLTALILIAGILAMVFLVKENWIAQEKVSNVYHQQYLSSKLKLVDYLDMDKCNSQKKEFLLEKINSLTYSYQCEKKSIFIKPKPTKDKYITFDNIHDWLDLEIFSKEIIYISSLSQLPRSSEDNPKIVVAQNAINEKLEQHFYGIIITDYYFDITGNKKIYGVLYSSFDNQREERNLTFRKSVIENIDKKFSYWQKIPYSQNLMSYE